MKKLIIIIALCLLPFAFSSAPSFATSTVSVCNMPSSASVQVRIYDNTDAAEDVAWTVTGVTERAVGLSKSCYHYAATLTAGHTYQIDWRDAASPTKVASETVTESKIDTAVELDGAVYRFTTNALELGPTTVPTYTLPAITGHVYTAVAAQQRKLTIVQGDTPRITFDLDADYTGWSVRFGAKVAAGDALYVIGPVTGAWTTAASGIGYVDLAATDTATAGNYKAEIEITSGASVMTAIKFDLTVTAQVVVP